MKVYSKIMIPLDGSELAELALPYAHILAQAFAAEVDLVGVAEGGFSDRLLKTYLDRLAQDWQGEGLKVRGVVQQGHPAEAIITYAEDNAMELVAMCTHGRSGVSRWVVGSVADKVLLGCRAPLLLVTPRVKPAEELFHTLLVPLDGSELAEKALPWAEELVKKLRTQLCLLRVYSPLPGVVMGELSNLDEIMKAQQRTASSYLGEFSRKLKKKGMEAQTEVVEGNAPEEILEYTRRHHIDLVVMSTHGRSGLGRWVLGSVTDRVVRAGEVPVLVVPSRA